MTRDEHTNTFRYTSAGDFLGHLLSFRDKYTYLHNDARWSGESFDKSVRLTQNGSLDKVHEANTLIEKLTTDLPELQPSWELDIAGAFPLVPDFLAGAPQHMMRKVIHPSQSVPISIYLGIVCSGGIQWKHMVERGTAVLALVLKLMQERPVEMYIFASMEGDRHGDATFIIPIPLQPLQLSETAYLITSNGFTRNLTYTLGAEYGFHGSWGKAFNCNQPTDVEATRKLLGAKESDLIIPAAYLTDELIYREPVKWINEKLSECRVHPEYDGD